MEFVEGENEEQILVSALRSGSQMILWFFLENIVIVLLTSKT